MTLARFGESTACGAVVVTAGVRHKADNEEQQVVLCHWEGKLDSWVVWDCYYRNDYGWQVGNGHYCRTLARAVEVFGKRCS